MTRLGGFGLPGMGSLDQTVEREILWGGDLSKGLALYKSMVLSGATRDAGATPTTSLRPGLILGQVAATGVLKEWNHDLTDGTQNIYGVLSEQLKATDFDANDADRSFRVLVRAPLQASQLLIEGVAFVGHANEYLARRVLCVRGCMFDDDPLCRDAFVGEPIAQFLAITSTTVTAANRNVRYVKTTADGTFTLPAIKVGLTYWFLNAADFEMVIASAEGDNMINGNDASADSITFTTAGEQIGAHVKMTCVNVSGTPKWLPTILKVNFSTDDFLDSTFAS